MSPLITLTTDFGLSEGYVAAMKGVILGINPQAAVVDVSHQVAPQDVAGAAFLLSTVVPYFPAGAIHVVVVDPGVGTDRRAIAVATPSSLFVAPDNGVLSYVLDEFGAWEGAETSLRPLPPGSKAVNLTKSAYWRHPVSATFHGRDIFAPVAAHLSRGVPMKQMGDDISSVVAFPIPKPERLADGSLSGEVIYVDRFGNLITDIRESDLPGGELVVEVAGRRINGLSASYAAGVGATSAVGGSPLLALIGSSGRLEVSLKNGNAARSLGARAGEKVKVRTM